MVKYKVLGFRVSEELYNAIQDQAKQVNLTVSEYLTLKLTASRQNSNAESSLILIRIEELKEKRRTIDNEIGRLMKILGNVMDSG